MRADAVILSCEHASAHVPEHYRTLFGNAASPRLLAGHRAYDIGAEAVALSFSRALGCPLFAGRVTRLLVDLNRSPTHPALFSSYSRSLSAAERQALLARYYLPFRTGVQSAIRDRIARGRRVIHLSVHSFTPKLSGVTRNADVGFLYDPARTGEAEFAADWQARLRRSGCAVHVRRNYPYRGVSDGHTSALRKSFDVLSYLGIELELNQLFFEVARQNARRTLIEALLKTLPLKHSEQRGA